MNIPGVNALTEYLVILKKEIPQCQKILVGLQKNFHNDPRFLVVQVDEVQNKMPWLRGIPTLVSVQDSRIYEGSAVQQFIEYLALRDSQNLPKEAVSGTEGGGGGAHAYIGATKAVSASKINVNGPGSVVYSSHDSHGTPKPIMTDLKMPTGGAAQTALGPSQTAMTRTPNMGSANPSSSPSYSSTGQVGGSGASSSRSCSLQQLYGSSFKTKDKAKYQESSSK